MNTEFSRRGFICWTLRRVQFAFTFAISASVASALAEPWFDAGVSSYESWPSDGSGLTVQGAGTWSGTASASLTAGAGGSRLSVDAEAEAPLGFTAAVSKSIAGDRPSITTTIRFSASDEPFPISHEDKALVTVAAVDGVPRYFGLGADVAGGTNKLHVLSGPAPVEDTDVKLGFSFKEENGATYVRYSIDGTVLTLDSAEWIRTFIPAENSSVSSVLYVGTGDIASLAGTVEAATVPVRMTIPEIAGMGVASVKVGGVAVEPDEDGRYEVPAGSLVTVSFTSGDSLYFLRGGDMVFTAPASDFTLPENGRPSIVDARDVLKITEVMASNETTLKTAGGLEGIDWVEVHNSADFAVDITGWKMSDNPAKASKWTPVAGPAVIPAGGYLVVWLDSGTDVAWHANDAHAAVGLSASGESIALATPDNALVSSYEFVQQFDDVSFGYGHFSKTVLSATSDAEYRVGGQGSWLPVNGPVGMSSAEGGFTVTTYAMNKAVSTMDVAEKYLADSTAWKNGYPVSAVAETIAFYNKESAPTTFPPYAGFPGMNGADDDNFVVVVAGTVFVPRAGQWSFSVGSDDGFTCEISRLGQSWSFENRGARGYAQSTAAFNLPEPGAYDVRLVYFENGGGAALDFSVAEGDKAFSAQDFRLVGSVESGVTHAGALGAHVAEDVSASMLGNSDSVEWRGTFTLSGAPAEGDAFRLRIRYADGFTASLNGTEFASAAANGARTAVEALTAEYFEIPASLVQSGENVLAVTGFNNDTDDTEFFLSPEVVWDMAGEQLLYFRTPTPGAANGSDGRRGLTPAVSFSVPHGYKTEPISLELSCADDPAAPIYYTMDGTSPTIASTRYTGAIAISSTTVVRAAVPDADSILQRDSSATYLYLADILQQQAGVVPEGFPADKSVNGQAMVYGMRDDIVNGDDATKAKLYRGFTNTIQTISLVVDPANFFDQSRGIYVNASGDGKGWERPTMVEQIDPVNGAANEFPGSSVPAGIRIRGAYSRGSGYPKHSLRLFFRDEYGKSKLDFPLFGAEGADEFKRIDLRTSQNYSWANGNENEFTLIEDVFARDSQRDMGETYNRSRYYNLFINGVYWGVYQTEERVDDHYAESYNGGSDEEYDVVRTSSPGYNTGVVEGDGAAWQALHDITVNQGYGGEHSANYNRVRGLNPDGSRNPDYPTYLNETNLMVYMITAQYAADSDSPANKSGMANNIATFRNRFDGNGLRDGFLWNRHDAEHSLGTGNGSSASDSTDCFKWGTRAAGHSTAIGNFNPAELNYELCFNDEYRMKFADQIYKHCIKKGGALTAPVAAERFRARMAELDDAVVCEAARWGRKNQTYSTWLNKGCAGRLNFIARRTPYLIQGYRNMGWYPSVDAPTAISGLGDELVGGTVVASDDRVYLRNANDGGTVYYTTDGSDPRLEGGEVNSSASAYTGSAPVVTTNSIALFAKGAEWQYYDWGRQPGDDTSGKAWNAEGYNVAALDGDPNAWAAGAAPLGFKNGTSFNTTLSRYVEHGSSGTQVMTFYFRRTFTIPDGVNLSEIVSLSGTAWYDDGFVMYVNGVEIGRGNIGAGYAVSYSTGTNETGTDYVDPADHAFVFALPSGVLHAGENVVAVEVHQCHGTSSDAAWDLALNFDRAVAGTGEGGIAVPGSGLRLKARFRSSSGEWSALEDVALDGEAPKLGDALRIHSFDGVPPSADGDEGEWIVLTNINQAASFDLTGVRVVFAKDGDGIAGAKCDVTLASGTIPAGGYVRLDQAVHGWNKITNNKLEIFLLDANGVQIQCGKVTQKATWQPDYYGSGGPGGTAYLAATSFGTELTNGDWIAVEPPALQDWPDDPDTEITDTTTAADLGITAGALADATPAELRRLAKWAKANSVPYAGAEVNGFAFAESGYTLFEEAYLLNCAPTAEVVAAKKVLFRFTEIIPGTVPSITGDFNGTVTILKATTLENGGDWAAEKVDPHFFKAMLTR